MTFFEIRLVSDKSIGPRRATALLIAFWLITFSFPPGDATAIQLIDPPKVTNQSTAQTVEQLLKVNWERDSENQSDARQTFTTLSPRSTAVSLAYILNRIQHNEPREALEVAGQSVERQPDAVDIWLLKAWLHSLINDYERSLIDLRSIKKQLAKNPQLDPLEKQQVYARLGRLVGYMQGPLNDKTNPDLLESTVQTIAKGTLPDEMKAFDKSRETILARYSELVKSQSEKTKLELEKQKAENDQLRISLTNQNQILEQTLQQLTAQKDRLRTEGSQRVSDLNSQLGPLERHQTSISSQISAVQNDLQLLYNDLYLVLNTQPRYRTSTNYLSSQIRGAEYQLIALQSDYNAILNQQQIIHASIHQTRLSYDSQIRQLEKEHNKAFNTQRRNRIKISKIDAGPELAAGKKGAMASRLTALTSYDELPLELYRQQLLESLPKK